MSIVGRPVTVPGWLQLLARAQGLRLVVHGADQLDASRELLFDVYHTELRWQPPAGNPSGLRVVTTPSPQLVDDYDAHAVWLGIQRGDHLVASWRVNRAERRGPAELTRYHPVAPDLLDGAMEVNRLAMRRSLRGGGPFALVALSLKSIAEHYGARRVLLTSEAPLSRKLYRPLGWRYTEVSFRYHEDDPHRCELPAMETGSLAVLTSLARTALRALVRTVAPPRRRALATATP